MKLIDIKTITDQHWDQMWAIYQESFPDYERRKLESHMKAYDNLGFRTQIAVEDDKLLALFFYWVHKDFLYIEHIAVNPQMRGNNIGSTIMRHFLEQNSGTTIILEIDPPLDEISIRRLGFYKRLGLQENPYPYTHPSYRKNGHVHRLDILSYPTTIDQKQYDEFCVFMKNEVLQYLDE